MFRKLLFVTCLIAFIPAIAAAQNLDGKQYTPGVDADIDLYINDWHDVMPFPSHGSLIERPILTKGDPLKPPTKGAALKYFNRFTHATLANGGSTTPTTLKGEQEVIYIISGKGTIQAKGGKPADLFPGITVLIPADLETTMKANPEEALTMYLISEPTPAGFRPNKELVIHDENMQKAVMTAHWAHIWKQLMQAGDGLGEIESIGSCSFDPMTIGHPHSHDTGVEEIWAAVSGTSVLFMGKQIRMQEPGMAYLIPPDGKTPHSNINTNKDTQVKMLYIARYKDHEVRK